MNDKFKMMGQLVASILIALVLFFYATTANYKNILSAHNANKNTAKETFTNTISNVPVTIEYDSEKYFISGFLPTTNVELIGSNRVILQKETDETTRTFQVVADLTDLAVGEHTIELQMTNLPAGINATMNPNYFIVKIGKRASKTFPVVGKISDSQLVEGYVVNKITVGTKTVRVTTDEETLGKIHHVEAIVPDASKLDSDFSGSATLQAVDNDGNILPVVFSQEITSIQAIISNQK